jgi:hypothetical protein
MTNIAYIEAVAFAPPGCLTGKPPERYCGRTALSPANCRYISNLLPPNERRRASPTVRMAFRGSRHAGSSIPASELASVFSSSDGDLSIAQRICIALAEPQRLISPTVFTTPCATHRRLLGIASSARPSTAIAAFDDNFAESVEALGMVQIEQTPALLRLRRTRP